MDIHKPKPWHSVREFLKEYVIIVVGVLTALGAEQAVETLHWSHKVDQAEAQERIELGQLYLNALDRDHIESCLDRRLDQLKAALLTGQGDWQPLAPMIGYQPAAVVVPRRAWFDEVWKSLIADGTAAHFSKEREIRLAEIHARSAWLEETSRAEVSDVSQLNLLQNRLDIPAAVRAELVMRIEQEKTRNTYMAIDARRVMTSIDSLGGIDRRKVEANVLSLSTTYRACAGLGLLRPAPRRRGLGRPPNSGRLPSRRCRCNGGGESLC